MRSEGDKSDSLRVVCIIKPSFFSKLWKIKSYPLWLLNIILFYLLYVPFGLGGRGENDELGGKVSSYYEIVLL